MHWVYAPPSPNHSAPGEASELSFGRIGSFRNPFYTRSVRTTSGNFSEDSSLKRSRTFHSVHETNLYLAFSEASQSQSPEFNERDAGLKLRYFLELCSESAAGPIIHWPDSASSTVYAPIDRITVPARMTRFRSL